MTDSSKSQDEGVLRDVLEELDRERSKRAELEDQIRQLTEDHKRQCEQHAHSAVTQAEARTQSQQVTVKKLQQTLISMEAQVQGYRQLIDALTAGKPAMDAAVQEQEEASSNSNSHGRSPTRRPGRTFNATLPLHVVRLLEILPWDTRVAEHIFGAEQVYEWQYFDVRERKWQSQLRYFPVLFRNLPISKLKTTHGQQQALAVEQQQQQQGNHQLVDGASSGSKANSKYRPTSGDDGRSNDRSLLVFLAGSDKSSVAPSKHGVLSNEGLTMLYNIEAGYPLPQNAGSWEWVGGWRIQKPSNLLTDSSAGAAAAGNPTVSSVKRVELICDEDGWSYAREAQQFMFTSPIDIFDNPGYVNESDQHKKSSGLPKRKVRRRKWIRRRVLVDYPFASERTKQYLKLLAENARLSEAIQKISDQLVDTKVQLTEVESAYMQMRETLRQKELALFSVASATSSLHDTGKGPSKGTTQVPNAVDAAVAIQEFLAKSDQVKEFSSKISNWVNANRKPSEDMTSLESVDGELLRGAAALTTTTSTLGTTVPSPVPPSAATASTAAPVDDSSSSSLQNPPLTSKFDWNRLGRGGLIDRLAAAHHHKATPSSSSSSTPSQPMSNSSNHRTQASSANDTISGATTTSTAIEEGNEELDQYKPYDDNSSTQNNSNIIDNNNNKKNGSHHNATILESG